METQKELLDRIADLEALIAELEARWPPHSVPPALLAQLDELEEALLAAQARLAKIPPDPVAPKP